MVSRRQRFVRVDVWKSERDAQVARLVDLVRGHAPFLALRLEQRDTCAQRVRSQQRDRPGDEWVEDAPAPLWKSPMKAANATTRRMANFLRSAQLSGSRGSSEGWGTRTVCGRESEGRREGGRERRRGGTGESGGSSGRQLEPHALLRAEAGSKVGRTLPSFATLRPAAAASSTTRRMLPPSFSTSLSERRTWPPSSASGAEGE